MVKARSPVCPVVMFTGTGSEEVAAAAMKAGLDDYVVKTPRHFERLMMAVDHSLDRASAPRRPRRDAGLLFQPAAGG